ncbi:hypothetical protein BYT27DRAFT_7191830 [Phlegmacium glaucopus]|nr:hypothetical protein BYT27DRAFT_7191830 [Phlegmacium glaucopus]
MSNLPPIPEIAGDIDLVLDVYTHISLRQPASLGQMNEEYGDTDRLAELGYNALELTVTHYLYSVRPFLSGRHIQDRKNEIVSDANIDRWLWAYRMKDKLVVAPAQSHVLNDPAEMRKYFHIFLGALFIRNGLPTIQDWISALIQWSSVPGNVPVQVVNDVVAQDAGPISQ